MKKVRIGSGSAYWGDALDRAEDLLKNGDLDYMGFDHLAELTMALLHRQKIKDRSKGYIPDIIPYTKTLLPIAMEKGTKLITDAGGANPVAGAEEAAKIAKDSGMKGVKIGVVSGDDVTNKLDGFLNKGIKLTNLETGEENLDAIKDKIVSAYAYVGAEGIIEALEQGCNYVIAGRVSDNALYVGPLMHEFGWKFEDGYWDQIGAAVTVGHIIECSCCVSGGMSNMWKQSPNVERIGYPLADFYENCEAVISKTPNSGGIVNEWTVKEHLVYEVHDPSNYLMPDGIADFTNISLEEIGKDQVKVTGMRGKPRPEKLKVCIGYEDGWIGEGMLLFPWPEAYERAQKAEEIIRARFELMGLKAEEVQVDYIGVNTLHGVTAPQPKYNLNEVGLRIAVKTRTQEDADIVRREATHLWTMGPVGTAFGVPFKPRKVIALWPTLVPREEIPTKVDILEVK